MTCNLCGRPIERQEDFDRGFCARHSMVMVMDGANAVKVEAGLEESVLYDHQEPEYIYGAPIGDCSAPGHPKDKDGFFIRTRYRILRPSPSAEAKRF